MLRLHRLAALSKSSLWSVANSRAGLSASLITSDIICSNCRLLRSSQNALRNGLPQVRYSSQQAEALLPQVNKIKWKKTRGKKKPGGKDMVYTDLVQVIDKRIAQLKSSHGSDQQMAAHKGIKNTKKVESDAKHKHRQKVNANDSAPEKNDRVQKKQTSVNVKGSKLKKHSAATGKLKQGTSEVGSSESDMISAKAKDRHEENLKELAQLTMQEIALLLDSGDFNKAFKDSLRQQLRRMKKKLSAVPNINTHTLKNIGDVQRMTEVVKKAMQKRTQKLAQNMAIEKDQEHRQLLHILEGKAYVEACVQANMLNKAHTMLMVNHSNQRRKHGPHARGKVYRDVSIYNTVMQGWAKKGRLDRISSLFAHINEMGLKPTLQSYSAVLECLSNRESPDVSMVEQVLADIQKQGFDVRDMKNDCVLDREQWKQILKVIQSVIPGYSPHPPKKMQNYTCPLLEHLNHLPEQQKYANTFSGVMSVDDLHSNSDRQFDHELQETVSLESIIPARDPDEKVKKTRELLAKARTEWRGTLTAAFHRDLRVLELNTKDLLKPTLVPFLKLFPVETYVDLMMQEVEDLGLEHVKHSPSLPVLHRMLGNKVFHKLQVQHKKQTGFVDEMAAMYVHYVSQYPEGEMSHGSQREVWQQVLAEHENNLNLNTSISRWPLVVTKGVGKFLYRIILLDLQVDADLFRNKNSGLKIPAFYTVTNTVTVQGEQYIEEEVRPHPVLARLYKDSDVRELTFDTRDLPSLVPPLPWSLTSTGGNLLATTDLIKNVARSHQQMELLKHVPTNQLNGIFDSLNTLGSCPWRINKRVLDVIIELFNNKGDESLDIPPPASECPMPNAELLESSYHERQKYRQRQQEMYSLWCTELYRLSIANKFRDEVFWFPHNLDFRGRVYAVPPHLNHLGGDVNRSLLVFAHGKPLGEHGLDWLKIHLINLTGFKKRASNKERLEYANEILPDILDSADHPMDGRCWWKSSDEPWQTLACCIEIAQAVRSHDPASYVSHFPVHQDGSCNGLQHYAALGRDQAGAESVNLHPFEAPADVYTEVAELVEAERRKDAEAGITIAEILDGFVRRKVIKQTVMTTVYGVTRYGAKYQILRQLEDIPEFPQEHVWQASKYLTEKTFHCLQEMFTATKEIQDWLTVSANLISAVSFKPVEWVTPVGLPVVQPYFRVHRQQSSKGLKNKTLVIEKPNTKKQMNAFPPNFIHSLDSTHMMLTAIHCLRAGITFVSVHDCFWTHACDVETMNKVCREQFVALHSQPILEELSHLMLTKFGYQREGKSMNILEDEIGNFTNFVMGRVPERGTFHLENVLKSTYFFS